MLSGERSGLGVEHLIFELTYGLFFYNFEDTL